MLVQSTKFVDYFRESFDTIFGQTAVAPAAMSERQLLQLMMLMHAKAGKTKLLDDEEQAIVNFWYHAIMDDDIGSCNRVHLRKMADLHEHQNGKANPNFELVHTVVRKNILDSCSQYFADLPNKLETRVSNPARLVELLSKYSEIASTSGGNGTRVRKLEIPVKQMIGVAKGASGTKVIDAWADGPCEQLLSALRDPQMKQYADFVDMSLYGPKEYLVLGSARVRQWISIVKMCQDISESIERIAQSSPLRTTMLDVRSCFGCLPAG